MSDNLQRTEYNITEEKWSSFIVVAVLEVYLIVDICHYFKYY